MWAFILLEYEFDIIHMVGRVNQDANGLNQNPSSNEEDTIRVCWHGDVDLEVILGCHAITYFCTLLGCYRDVAQISMKFECGDSHDANMELEGDGALNIIDDAFIIAYLQASEVPIGLTPKEQNRDVHKAKWFKWSMVQMGRQFLPMGVGRWTNMGCASPITM